MTSANSDVGWLPTVALWRLMDVLAWLFRAKDFLMFFFSESMEQQSKWVDLPDVVIIEVFKFLSDKDRASMAIVCQNWCRLFRTPGLWRYRHFDLGGYRGQINGQRACQFAEKFGRYLRYLSITCNHPSYHTCKYFQKSLEDLFSKIGHAKLVDFELERLELDRYWKYETPREKLINCFSKFFKSQRNLECFDMSAGQFPVPGGCKILESIGQNSGSTLSDMLLEDFFHPRLAVFQVKRYLTAMSKFTNLKYISVNYNCLSEDIIELFTKNLKNKMEAMNIKVYRSDPHFHRISGFAWKALNMACPRLKVNFWFESVGESNSIIPILVKEVPAKDIHLWTGYDDDAEWRLSETLDHISACYSSSIEAISLELDNNHELIDHQLISMVTKCKSLKELSVNAVLMVQTVDRLCELQEEGKIDLEMLHMTCCGLSEEEWVTLMSLREKYMDMIADRRLNFKFATDLLIDASGI